MRWHGVHLQIEGPSVTQVKDALLIPTLKRVRGLPRQTDVCGGLHPPPCTVGGDIGECPLQPDIHLVARMTMIRDDIFWRRSQEDFASTLGKITAPKEKKPFGSVTGCVLAAEVARQASITLKTAINVLWFILSPNFDELRAFLRHTRPVFLSPTIWIALLFGVWHCCCPKMGYKDPAVQSHCACSAQMCVHKGRVGLAAPVVQVAVGQSGAEVGAS
jgi:hypothetical protein